MTRRLPLLALLVLLSACQSTQVQRDYDPERDFSAYRSWSWKEPAVRYRPDDPRLGGSLTEQRLRAAIAEQLDQHGLRPAAPEASADLQVQVWFIVDERTQQYSTTSGAGAWGGPWHGFWGGPLFVETRSIDYQVGTLQVDFHDARDGQLVWRGSGEQILRRDPGSPQERTERLRQTVSKVLSQYPPR